MFHKETFATFSILFFPGATWATKIDLSVKDVVSSSPTFAFPSSLVFFSLRYDKWHINTTSQAMRAVVVRAVEVSAQEDSVNQYFVIGYRSINKRR